MNTTSQHTHTPTHTPTPTPMHTVGKNYKPSYRKQRYSSAIHSSYKAERIATLLESIKEIAGGVVALSMMLVLLYLMLLVGGLV